MKTIVVIPTFNEADNVVPITEAILALGIENLSVLFVDDDSPDGTVDVVAGLVTTYPGQVYLIHRPGKMGLGTAYKDGFRRALDMGADRIVQMDADFSHSPAYIPQMLDLLEDYAVVIGSRYVPGGSRDERWGIDRRLLSWWANFYTRVILRISVKDTTAGFKVWRRHTLIGIDLSRIHSNGYDFQVEMTYAAEKLGYRSKEIPIHFEDRRIGQSKMDVPVKIEAALRVWDILWRHRQLNPSMRAPYKLIPPS
ncbi:MAG: polyprenol monophosphomannose synthase [Chloroflexi bacterium]|nr:polyprenol monophosphomannose synthase [Chloroflexota bacterium]